MRTFEQTDYKNILREKVKTLNSTSAKKMSFRKISEKLGIQHTHLSRVLNNDHLHLSEDQLFEISDLLGFSNEEIDYVMLLRSHVISTSQKRSLATKRKIEQLQSHHLKAHTQEFKIQQLHKEIDHLLDPYSVIVLAALSIPKFAQKPKELSDALGISFKKLQSNIEKLSQMELLEHDPETFVVRNLKDPHMHYSTDHPLMRAHQNMLRTLGSAQLMKLNDDSKKSIMVTFGADPKIIEQVKLKFMSFLGEIEPLVINSKPTQIYQISFDLFPWT